MESTYKVNKNDFVNAGKVSSDIKTKLKLLGVDSKKLRSIAVASYEAEINMIIHSNGGVITSKLNDDGSLVISFNDSGPGIADLEKALTPGFSTASKEAREFGFGAGMGLPNIIRNADSYTIDTSPKGTYLVLTFNL